jgi:NAD(P)H-hydrate repair Nnr-like enzyme with NAD(P)H-hydrate dehydratase domain
MNDPDNMAPGRVWLVAGTIPDPEFPLTVARCATEEGCGQALRLTVGDFSVPVDRGTPALLASAVLAANTFFGKAPEIWALVAGDTGDGQGSRQVYKAFAETAENIAPAGVTFHYLLPDVDWHGKVLMAVQGLPATPQLVADAGFMYAAKMSGYAGEYDLFTPDIGELAFLADLDAPHPFYTRNFLLADEDMAEELIVRAHEAGNAARHMLVKGKTDRYVREGATVAAVSSPDVPMLEPIGGTGDTLTGLVTALLSRGLPMEAACVAAMRANRFMGELAVPTPESGIADLLGKLPQALLLALNDQDTYVSCLRKRREN